MANYKAALRDIDNPNSVDYKPFPPPAGLLPGFLIQNRDYLQSRVNYWTGVKGSGSNSKERANIDKILAELNKKITGYNAAISVASAAAIPTVEGTTNTTTTDDLIPDKPSIKDPSNTAVDPSKSPASAKKVLLIGGSVLLLTVIVIIVIKRRK